MRFGVILLVFIVACSLAGSLIPQGRPQQWYIQNYPSAGKVFLALEFNNLFYSWYFVLLIVLSCVNIFSCSVIRLYNLLKTGSKILTRAEDAPGGRAIGTDAADSLRSYLVLRRYRQHKAANAVVFYKNMAGRYGSFIVHLSLLFILIFGGLVLWLSETADHTVMPGETLVFEDGTELELESFRITDETGRADYVSMIHVTSPGGATTSGEISVNYPLSFHSIKYYQQQFGTAGSVSAVSAATGEEDIFYLTDQSFLSGDGHSGIWYTALFPGYVEDEHGHIMPISVMGNAYPNPVYHVLVSDDGEITPKMVLPGETIHIGDIIFKFNEPVNYPGIRVKHIPNPFPGLLYGSFVLMIVGFWLCFFYMPAIVTVTSDSYAVSGGKASGEQLMIDTFLKEIEK